MAYVLIVDDDPDAQEVLHDIVEMAGMQTLLADDGLEALNLITKNQPAMIFLDLMMPKLDGFGVLRKLRSDPATRYIPVIVVTACARDQIDMLRLPGVTSVVQKGYFTVDSMTTLIKKIVGSPFNNGGIARRI